MGTENQEILRRKSYGEMLKKHPEFEGVILEKSWEHIGSSDKGTVDYFRPIWLKHIKQNAKLWKKSGKALNFAGIGAGKAVIAIGAGPSLKKNLDDLHYMYEREKDLPWSKRNFIFVASNHMLKPLLKSGFVPDFAIVMDGGEVCNMHLNEDYPRDVGQKVVLLAGMHCHPTVLRRWRRQGRRLALFTTLSDGFEDTFRKHCKDDYEKHMVLPGGNVINTTWSIAGRFFASSVFMCVGNDLSYPLVEKIEDRRNGYYADGDYRANLKNLRDEAKKKKTWAGFNIVEREINGKQHYDIKLSAVATTGTLWVYKTWIEANIIANYAESPKSFHYYNCTEGGILGVMSDQDPTGKTINEVNFFLLDEKCKRWRTRKLMDAAAEFMYAKEQLWKNERKETRTSVQGVDTLVLPPEDTIVKGVRRPKKDGTKTTFLSGEKDSLRGTQQEEKLIVNSL